MHPTPVRRFTIADGMVLVTAAAVGMLILRSYLPGLSRQLRLLPTVAPDPWGLWRAHTWLHGPGSCLVVPWMAATIALRLRGPRPARTRLACQPGFVACLAVMASLVPGLAWYATIRHRPGFQRPEGFEQAWAITTHLADTAVLGGWIALLLARRWRPEPSWVDRMGRALGLYWVLLLMGVIALQWSEAIQRLFSGGST